MTEHMKTIVRENVTLIDENNFDEFYKKVTLATHTYQDVSDVTEFLMNSCNIDPMPHLTNIPWAYLYKCETLNEVNILEGIESIKIGAYLGSSIRKLRLPKSCKEVYVQAFSGCTRLTDVRIENPDIVIDTSAFTRSDNIECVEYNGTIKQFKNKLWPDQLVKDSYIICLDGTVHAIDGRVTQYS